MHSGPGINNPWSLPQLPSPALHFCLVGTLDLSSEWVQDHQLSSPWRLQVPTSHLTEASTVVQLTIFCALLCISSLLFSIHYLPPGTIHSPREHLVGTDILVSVKEGINFDLLSSHPKREDRRDTNNHSNKWPVLEGETLIGTRLNLAGRLPFTLVP